MVALLRILQQQGKHDQNLGFSNGFKAIFFIYEIFRLLFACGYSKNSRKKYVCIQKLDVIRYCILPLSIRVFQHHFSVIMFLFERD